MAERFQWSVLGLVFLAGCGATAEEQALVNSKNTRAEPATSQTAVVSPQQDNWLDTQSMSPAQKMPQTKTDSPKSMVATQPSSSPARPLSAATALPPGNGLVPSAAIDPQEIAKIKQRIEELSELATAAQNEFRFAQAIPYWREMGLLLTQAYGPGSWQVTNARIAEQLATQQSQMSTADLERMRELFMWQQRIGELLSVNSIPGALTLAEGSATRTAELFGAQSYMKGKQQLQVARMKQMLGRNEEAAEAYRDAYQLMAPHLGQTHPELEGLHSYLGECQLALGQTAQGIENLRAASRQAVELWGSNSVKFAARANDLGVAYQRSGDLDMALKIIRTAEEIRRQQLGENHPQVGHSLLNLGTIYIENKNLVLAQQCLEQAMPILEQIPQPNRLLIDAQAKMAVVKMLLNAPEQAEPLLTAVVNGLTQIRADDRELGIAEHRLGVALAKQGKYDRAEPVLRASEQRLAGTLGNDHNQTAKVREALVQLLVQTGRQREADAMKSGIRQVNFDGGGNGQFER